MTNKNMLFKFNIKNRILGPIRVKKVCHAFVKITNLDTPVILFFSFLKEAKPKYNTYIEMQNQKGI